MLIQSLKINYCKNRSGFVNLFEDVQAMFFNEKNDCFNFQGSTSSIARSKIMVVA